MVRYLFTGINLICLTLLAYWCVRGAYVKIGFDSFAATPQAPQVEMADDVRKPGMNRHAFGRKSSGIVSRNLFNVLLEKKVQPRRTPEKTVKSSGKIDRKTLRIRLAGTVTGGGELYAVIEDEKKRKQALYKTGDTIQGRVLRNVFRDYVLLEQDGLVKRLEMSPDNKRFGGGNRSSSGQRPMPDPAPKTREIMLDAGLSKALGDTETLKKQIRSRPHHSKGESNGILVYGIRADSVFSRMGLRNGDVIQEVNGEPVASVDEVLAAVRDIESLSTVTYSLVRGGRQKQMIYKINTGEE